MRRPVVKSFIHITSTYFHDHLYTNFLFIKHIHTQSCFHKVSPNVMAPKARLVGSIPELILHSSIHSA